MYNRMLVESNVILPKTDTIIDLILDMISGLAAGFVSLGMLEK